MNKAQIADNLIRIKALQDALKAEMNELRQHIAVGEKVSTDLGSVNHVDSSRTSYDEAGLFRELNRLGIDPETVGEVVVKVDRKKIANAITSGAIPSNLVDVYSETKLTPTLRITPKKGNEDLTKETMDRVASVVKK